MTEGTTKISIAYSPDTDDAFMITPLRERLVDWGSYEFEFIVGDIQELNAAAVDERYDITAISVAAYPHIRDRYWFLPIGSSIGDNFGPVIITCKDSAIDCLAALKGKSIAVPGLQTTAYLAACDVLGEFDARPKYFMDIESQVRDGQVDAGILIHELQLESETKGFRKLGDLGSLWMKKYGLPLPLGANAIKRALPTEQVRELAEIYRKSIAYALNHREETLERAIAQAKAKLDKKLGDRYISMYVNNDSLDLRDQVLQGIETLYARGVEKGLFSPFIIRDFMIGASQQGAGHEPR